MLYGNKYFEIYFSKNNDQHLKCTLYKTPLQQSNFQKIMIFIFFFFIGNTDGGVDVVVEPVNRKKKKLDIFLKHFLKPS